MKAAFKSCRTIRWIMSLCRHDEQASARFDAFRGKVSEEGNHMMTLKALKSLRSFSALFVLLFLYVFGLRAAAFGQTAAAKSATIEDIRVFFKGQQKKVLTFVGYSGAGYEDEASMRNMRSAFSANTTRLKRS